LLAPAFFGCAFGGVVIRGSFFTSTFACLETRGSTFGAGLVRSFEIDFLGEAALAGEGCFTGLFALDSAFGFCGAYLCCDLLLSLLSSAFGFWVPEPLVCLGSMTGTGFNFSGFFSCFAGSCLSSFAGDCIFTGLILTLAKAADIVAALVTLALAGLYTCGVGALAFLTDVLRSDLPRSSCMITSGTSTFCADFLVSFLTDALADAFGGDVARSLVSS